jgi:hypothetical protein
MTLSTAFFFIELLLPSICLLPAFPAPTRTRS